MRLDKLLSHGAGIPRSQAQREIRSGAVLVDGGVSRDPSLHVTNDRRVEFQGRRVCERGPRYFMVHKPAGYVSVTDDAHHPSVLELLPGDERAGLHAAGRLDADATGLVLLTDDGDWSHRITSPRRGCDKTYRVYLAASLSENAAERVQTGVQLHGEKRPTAPAHLLRITATEVLLTIAEGKYHQVKRMFAAVGNQVLALHRERIGGLVLDSTLTPGAHRPLTADEIAGVFAGEKADEEA